LVLPRRRVTVSSARGRAPLFAEEGVSMAVPLSARKWTLRELHRLPDDGNRYELVRGELFVTPAPTYVHETIAAIIHEALAPYVQEHTLGRVYRPRSVVRVRPNTEVEPDLMVRPIDPPGTTWERASRPMLVVEIVSDVTRRRDHHDKRALYLELGVPEYWIVEPADRAIHVARVGQSDMVAASTLSWHPAGAGNPFVLDVARMFREALGP
jgi:Uma2 family endonuclease